MRVEKAMMPARARRFPNAGAIEYQNRNSADMGDDGREDVKWKNQHDKALTGALEARDDGNKST